jgi:hypothetical protein
MSVKHLTDQNGSQHTPGYSGIHIKPSHKGLLHKKLGIAQGKPIPASDLAVKPGDSPATVKEKTFARTAKKWNH